MEITVSPRPQGLAPVTVLVLRGEMTADSAAPFEEAAAGAIAGGARYLVIDMTGVPFVGSFGIRSLNNVLLALHQAADGESDAELRRALRDGGRSPRLKLAGVTPQARKVLETSGLDLYLEMLDTVEDAVASLPPANRDSVGAANG